MDVIVREFRKSPFCRQNKDQLRFINMSASRKELPAIRNLYFTLTEIASNQNNDQINIYLFDIAKISWLSEKTISKSLDILKKWNIVYFEPQERWTDGKYKSKEIILIDWDITVRKLKENWKKVERKKETQVSYIIENNKEDNKENTLETFSKEKEEETSLAEEEKKEYWDPEINECLRIIKKYNNWIIDWTLPRQRQFGNHLIKKLKTIDSVLAWKFTRQQILEMILDIVSKNEFHYTKIAWPEKIFRNLAVLQQICRMEISSNKWKAPVRQF